MNSGHRFRTVRTRLDGLSKARGLVLAAASLLAVDLGLGWAQGQPVSELVARLAVLAVSLAGIASYLASRTTRSLNDSERDLRERQESLLRNSSDLILIVDDSGTVRYQSPSVERTLGYGHDQLLGTVIETLVAPSDGSPILDLLNNLSPGSRAQFDAQARLHDGRFLLVDAVLANLSDDPHVGGLVLTMHDVSKWKDLEEQLTQQALHDVGTGLPNRALLFDRLEHALGRRRRHGKGVAVLFLDLDDFKTVNDSLGHIQGDNLIKLVAARLTTTLRPGDTAARVGGDEFALLLEEVDEEQAVAVAGRVLAEMEVPFELGDRPLLVGVSVGIALSSSDLPTATDLLRAADIAMYEAKSAGKAQYRVFEQAMRDATTERLRLGADLRGAIEREEFVLHYQPVLELSDGSVTCMEALVRWNHPERGLVAPGAFIPLAEQTGLIVPLGSLVLREACRQARSWQLARPDRPVKVSVNLSGIQVQDIGLVAAVSLALEQAELPPELLILEITESVVAHDQEPIIRRLRQLKGLGVGLAIDDFGTGYSSLSYLRQFPIDLVKIDKSFIDGVGSGAEASALGKAIVRLAHSLKLKTVAEGVETEAQAKALTQMGCDRAQGFHFARPMSPDQASAYLLGHTRISLWVGYTGHELEVMTEVVDDFETSHPHIRVDVVGGVFDDRIIPALRQSEGPTVISSFESDNFGIYASAGGLLDLGPYLARDGIDDSILTEATRSYTRFGGKRWALPMLADAYGLYYNRDLFAEAGVTGPPTTIAELTSFAKRMTKRDSDGALSVVGFDPMDRFYENSVASIGHLFGVRWIDEAGRSSLASDPAWVRMLRWQKDLVEWYGYDDLVRFQERVGEEFAPTNAFATGRLAMYLDGEWRVAFQASQGSRVDYGTAPLPVDDTRPDLFGSGYINGTIIGIRASADHKSEGWELVKYLTTNDAALAKLSNGLRNIPSTKSALTSPDLLPDPHFAVFLDIFAHPQSSTTPITAVGAAYQSLVSEFVGQWLAGDVADLQAGLREVDRAIDAQLRKATGGKAPMAELRPVPDDWATTSTSRSVA